MNNRWRLLKKLKIQKLKKDFKNKKIKADDYTNLINTIRFNYWYLYQNK